MTPVTETETMNMPLYEGTKRLYAKPMTLGDYNNYRGWPLPSDAEPDAPGYLVEYVDGGKANDSRHAGYISWSPADVFERAYKPVPEAPAPVTETELAAKAVAPRVTPADIEAAIASEHYFTAQDGRNGALYAGLYAGREKPTAGDFDLQPLGLLTICVLVLRNGFTVTGTSACASPENFDPDIGRRVARQDAVRQVWPLLGYALRERLAGGAA